MSILAEYRKSLKRIEVEEPPDVYIFRPLAFLFVKTIYRTNITPNQVTVASLFVGVVSGIGFGIGRPSAVVWGAVIFGLSIVLDCADGQLARLKKNGTRLGRILDGLIDYVVTIAVYLGLGIGLAPASPRPALWWALLAATGASHIFHSASVDYYRSRFLARVEGSAAAADDDDYRSFKAELDDLRAGKGRRLRKAAIGLYLRYLDGQKKMTSRAAGSGAAGQAGADAYCARNKAAMRGWTLLGPSMGGILLIVCAVVGRVDLYLWGRIVVMNLWAAVMYVIQFRIDRESTEERAI